jgi:hypothetical protein
MNHISRDQQPTDPSWRPPQYSPGYEALSTQPTAKGIAAKFSVTSGLLYGGLAFAATSLFLPWTTVSAPALFGSPYTADASPFRGGWIFLILSVIVGAGWLAWPTILGAQMLLKRLAGLSAVVCLLIGFFLIGFVNYANAVSEKQEAVTEAGNSFASIEGAIDVSLGFGFVLYTAALVAIAVGLGRVWMQRLTAGKRAP